MAGWEVTAARASCGKGAIGSGAGGGEVQAQAQPRACSSAVHLSLSPSQLSEMSSNPFRERVNHWTWRKPTVAEVDVKQASTGTTRLNAQSTTSQPPPTSASTTDNSFTQAHDQLESLPRIRSFVSSPRPESRSAWRQSPPEPTPHSGQPQLNSAQPTAQPEDQPSPVIISTSTSMHVLPSSRSPSPKAVHVLAADPDEESELETKGHSGANLVQDSGSEDKNEDDPDAEVNSEEDSEAESDGTDDSGLEFDDVDSEDGMEMEDNATPALAQLKRPHKSANSDSDEDDIPLNKRQRFSSPGQVASPAMSPISSTPNGHSPTDRGLTAATAGPVEQAEPTFDGTGVASTNQGQPKVGQKKCMYSLLFCHRGALAKYTPGCSSQALPPQAQPCQTASAQQISRRDPPARDQA